jgi:hypothetical protein
MPQRGYPLEPATLISLIMKMLYASGLAFEQFKFTMIFHSPNPTETDYRYCGVGSRTVEVSDVLSFAKRQGDRLQILWGWL